MQFSARLGGLSSKVYYRHVDVPIDVVEHFKALDIKRFICTFNGEYEKHCALLSHGDGRHYIIMNEAECKQLGLSMGSELHVELKEDKSKYGMPMPEEMEELLRQDPEADAYFHALTPGKQRSLLYIVGKPKGTDTRLRKAIAVCEHLHIMNGKLDFALLNEHIKNSRLKR